MTDERIILVALVRCEDNGASVNAVEALERITQRLADYEIAAQARADRIVQLEAELAAERERCAEIANQERLAAIQFGWDDSHRTAHNILVQIRHP